MGRFDVCSHGRPSQYAGAPRPVDLEGEVGIAAGKLHDPDRAFETFDMLREVGG
jgi:hypothetical protein